MFRVCFMINTDIEVTADNDSAFTERQQMTISICANLSALCFNSNDRHILPADVYVHLDVTMATLKF